MDPLQSPTVQHGRLFKSELKMKKARFSIISILSLLVTLISILTVATFSVAKTDFAGKEERLQQLERQKAVREAGHNYMELATHSPVRATP